MLVVLFVLNATCSCTHLWSSSYMVNCIAAQFAFFFFFFFFSFFFFFFVVVVAVVLFSSGWSH